MKSVLGTFLVLTFLVAFSPVPASADVTLFDWRLKVDSTVLGPGDLLPGNVNAGAFDFSTGLGTLAITVTGAGSHYVSAFFDHELSEGINTFFNEFGTVAGSPGAGVSWEIDEPGWVFGNIYDNFIAGALDNSNGVPSTAPDDVSMALAWSFVLAADEVGQARYSVGTAPPASGFYLQQTDPESGENIYLSAATGIGPAISDVPEPGSLLLFATMAGAIVATRRFMLR